MLSQSKARQVGFIRVSSCKNIAREVQKQKELSSDSFSSFQYGDQKYHQQFGHHTKKQQKIKVNNKDEKQVLKNKQYKNKCNNIKHPPLPKGQKLIVNPFQNDKLKTKVVSINQKQMLNQQTTKNQQQRKSIQQQLKKVENICQKINNMNLQENFSFSQKKSHQRKIHQKRSSQYQKQKIYYDMQSEQQEEDIQVMNLPQKNNKLTQKKSPFKQINDKKFKYEFSDSSSESQYDHKQQKDNYKFIKNEHQQLKQSVYVLNHGNNYQQLAKKQIYSRFDLNQNQNEEELILNYDKLYFQQKYRNQKHNNQIKNIQNSQDYYKTQGGVCFDINTKQFVGCQSANLIKSNKSGKKSKTMLNQKQQILKRRQIAKVYDKQARFRLFGFA